MGPITPIRPISHANFDGLLCILHIQRILSVGVFDFALGSTMSGKRHEPLVGGDPFLGSEDEFLDHTAQVEDSGPGICAEAVSLR